MNYNEAMQDVGVLQAMVGELLRERENLQRDLDEANSNIEAKLTAAKISGARTTLEVLVRIAQDGPLSEVFFQGLLGPDMVERILDLSRGLTPRPELLVVRSK